MAPVAADSQAHRHPLGRHDVRGDAVEFGRRDRAHHVLPGIACCNIWRQRSHDQSPENVIPLPSSAQAGAGQQHRSQLEASAQTDGRRLDPLALGLKRRTPDGEVVWDLEALGRELRRRLGCPAYRIDRDPPAPDDFLAPLAIAEVPMGPALQVWSSMSTVGSIVEDGTLHLHPDAFNVESPEIPTLPALERTARAWLRDQIAKIVEPRDYTFVRDVHTGVNGVVCVAFMRPFSTVEALAEEQTCSTQHLQRDYAPDDFR